MTNLVRIERHVFGATDRGRGGLVGYQTVAQSGGIDSSTARELERRGAQFERARAEGGTDWRGDAIGAEWFRFAQHRVAPPFNDREVHAAVALVLPADVAAGIDLLAFTARGDLWQRPPYGQVDLAPVDESLVPMKTRERAEFALAAAGACATPAILGRLVALTVRAIVSNANIAIVASVRDFALLLTGMRALLPPELCHRLSFQTSLPATVRGAPVWVRAPASGAVDLRGAGVAVFVPAEGSDHQGWHCSDGQQTWCEWMAAALEAGDWWRVALLPNVYSSSGAQLGEWGQALRPVENGAECLQRIAVFAQGAAPSRIQSLAREMVREWFMAPGRQDAEVAGVATELTDAAFAWLYGAVDDRLRQALSALRSPDECRLRIVQFADGRAAGPIKDLARQGVAHWLLAPERTAEEAFGVVEPLTDKQFAWLGRGVEDRLSALLGEVRTADACMLRIRRCASGAAPPQLHAMARLTVVQWLKSATLADLTAVLRVITDQEQRWIGSALEERVAAHQAGLTDLLYLGRYLAQAVSPMQRDNAAAYLKRAVAVAEGTALVQSDTSATGSDLLDYVATAQDPHRKLALEVLATWAAKVAGGHWLAKFELVQRTIGVPEIQAPVAGKLAQFGISGEWPLADHLHFLSACGVDPVGKVSDACLTKALADATKRAETVGLAALAMARPSDWPDHAAISRHLLLRCAGISRNETWVAQVIVATWEQHVPDFTRPGASHRPQFPSALVYALRYLQHVNIGLEEKLGEAVLRQTLDDEGRLTATLDSLANAPHQPEAPYLHGAAWTQLLSACVELTIAGFANSQPVGAAWRRWLAKVTPAEPVANPLKRMNAVPWWPKLLATHLPHANTAWKRAGYDWLIAKGNLDRATLSYLCDAGFVADLASAIWSGSQQLAAEAEWRAVPSLAAEVQRLRTPPSLPTRGKNSRDPDSGRSRLPPPAPTPKAGYLAQAGADDRGPSEQPAPMSIEQQLTAAWDAFMTGPPSQITVENLLAYNLQELSTPIARDAVAVLLWTRALADSMPPDGSIRWRMAAKIMKAYRAELKHGR